MNYPVIAIARICHEANRAYCQAIGDDSQPAWGLAPDWQRESAINGVKFHLTGDKTPEQSHESWLAEKVAGGWVYGDVKDPDLKTHPCIRPYAELPEAQKVKDRLFGAIVDAFKPVPAFDPSTLPLDAFNGSDRKS